MSKDSLLACLNLWYELQEQDRLPFWFRYYPVGDIGRRPSYRRAKTDDDYRDADKEGEVELYVDDDDELPGVPDAITGPNDVDMDTRTPVAKARKKDGKATQEKTDKGKEKATPTNKTKTRGASEVAKSTKKGAKKRKEQARDNDTVEDDVPEVSEYTRVSTGELLTIR